MQIGRQGYSPCLPLLNCGILVSHPPCKKTSRKKGICKRLSRILKEITCITNKLKRFALIFYKN
jgi:hypothetical protein